MPLILLMEWLLGNMENKGEDQKEDGVEGENERIRGGKESGGRRDALISSLRS